MGNIFKHEHKDTSRIPLTIGVDTLWLSITTDKPGGMVLPVVVHLYQSTYSVPGGSSLLSSTFVFGIQNLALKKNRLFCHKFQIRCNMWRRVWNSWNRLFCTMWQFVTRSRYKNKVHVWVFLENKSDWDRSLLTYFLVVTCQKPCCFTLWCILHHESETRSLTKIFVYFRSWVVFYLGCFLLE